MTHGAAGANGGCWRKASGLVALMMRGFEGIFSSFFGGSASRNPAPHRQGGWPQYPRQSFLVREKEVRNSSEPYIKDFWG